MAEISPNWNALYSNQGIRLQGNPVLDGLRQQVAQRQQQQQKDNDNFTSQISKLNFGGAKDADADYLHKQYGDILNTFGQLRNVTDPNQRAKLGLQLQQKQNSFAYDVEKSKQANQEEMKAADLVNSPTAPISDNFHSLWGDLNKTPTFSPDYQTKKGAFQSGMYDKQVADLSKLSNDALGEVKSTSKTSGTPIKDAASGELKTPTFNTTSADKAAFSKNLAYKIHADPKAQKAVALAYPDLDIGTATEHYVNDAWATHQGKLGTDTTYSAPFESIKQKMALQENNARLRQLYPGASQQPTPLQVAATPLQQAFKTNPEVGKQQFDKMILPHLPTKGMEEPITTSIDNGQFVIHIPDKRTGAKSVVPEHEVRVDINDPYWGSNLQTKLQQEGMNVSDFNQSYKGGKTKIESTQSKLPRQVKSDEDYKSLPRGEQYVAPNGKVYIKK